MAVAASTPIGISQEAPGRTRSQKMKPETSTATSAMRDCDSIRVASARTMMPTRMRRRLGM